MDSFKEILTIIEFYCEAQENPEVFIREDMNSMKKIFQACKFIEQVIKRVEEEKKEVEFESHVTTRMLMKKKKTVYKCKDLKNACDKMLELYLKQEKISNEFVDEVIKIYLQHCGPIRLEANINRIMMNSMQANAILQILKNLEFNETDIEDELEIALWENDIAVGRREKVVETLLEMFDKQHISKLIRMAYKSEPESAVNSMILELFTKKLEENDIVLYSELKDIQRKVLLKLLNDNSEFQLSFIDATFYIGRNMDRDEEDNWVTESGFSFDDLKNVIISLLDGPDDLHKLIINRIKIAKELDDVWKDVERQCVL